MKRQPKAKQQVTRRQLALVAVLGVILVGVVASNFSSDAPEVTAEVAAAAEATPAEAAADAKAGPFGDFAEDKNWPAPALDELVSFDPFADGTEPDAISPQYEAKELDELRNAQDAIIFMTGGQTVARIGTKEYHVGDMVGGLQIRDISSRGIVLGEPN